LGSFIPGFAAGIKSPSGAGHGGQLVCINIDAQTYPQETGYVQLPTIGEVMFNLRGIYPKPEWESLDRTGVTCEVCYHEQPVNDTVSM
jgi:hypothetical protein